MSQTTSSSKQQRNDATATKVDLKFEVAIVPVEDVDHAKIRCLDTFVEIDGSWLFSQRRLYVDWLENRAL